MFDFFKKKDFFLEIKDPSVLLKEATAAKQSGNLEKAIEILRTAYKEIPKSGITYSTQTFLRLPMYLQEANKPDEAWKEFEYLLKKGVPNESRDQQLIPMYHAVIYDKMRLFLQKEKRNQDAVKYGILSHLSQAYGLYKQKRKTELKRLVNDENLEKLIQKLLKKAKKIDFYEKIFSLIKHEVKKIPNINFDELGNMIDNLLNSKLN